MNEKQHKKGTAPVIFEKYNEITFFEPTEAFNDTLMANSYQKYKERSAQVMAQQQAIQNGGFDQAAAANAVAALNIAKYANYLSMNGHKPLLRMQFKEHFAQKDAYTRQERQDLDKLEMALHYIKELNQTKAVELEHCEHMIKDKIDEK